MTPDSGSFHVGCHNSTTARLDPAYGETGVDAIVIMQCAQELCLPHSLKEVFYFRPKRWKVLNEKTAELGN